MDQKEITLKRRALEQKHLLEQYFTLYDAFQEFVDKLKPYVQGEPGSMEMFAAYERFRLLFSEHQADFLKWHDGVQVTNEGVGAFIDNVDQFENQPGHFRMMLTAATTKFEVLTKIAARGLSPQSK